MGGLRSILNFMGSSTARVFQDKILGWLALKGLLALMFITVVPLILNNFAYDIIEIVMNFAAGQASSSGSFNGAMAFTGLMGWLIDCFCIPQAVSVLVSAFCLRLALSMIPLVRLI